MNLSTTFSMISSVQRIEMNNAIQTVSEFRAKKFFNGFFAFASVSYSAITETDGLAAHFPGSGIGSHDNDDISKIRLFTVIIGQGGMIQNLKQNIKHIRVGFFNFIQKKNAVRMFTDAVGQKSALIKPDISRRGADQTRPRHVFPYIHSYQTAKTQPRECWQSAWTPRSFRHRWGR